MEELNEEVFKYVMHNQIRANGFKEKNEELWKNLVNDIRKDIVLAVALRRLPILTFIFSMIANTTVNIAISVITMGSEINLLHNVWIIMIVSIFVFSICERMLINVLDEIESIEKKYLKEMV